MVWMRSSKGFQGTYSFSVYDDADELAFRVDNCSRRRKLFAGEQTLMGRPRALLLSMRLLLATPQEAAKNPSSPSSLGAGEAAKILTLAAAARCTGGAKILALAAFAWHTGGRHEPYARRYRSAHGRLPRASPSSPAIGAQEAATSLTLAATAATRP